MTLKKLLALLEWIRNAEGINLRGSFLQTTGGGELAISFNTQPPRSLHDVLMRRGFILWEGEYIYRPYK